MDTRRLFCDVEVSLRLHTVAHRDHHFIDGLNGRSKGSMNNVLGIREVEMGSFTPLVFSRFGGMSHASTVSY